MVYDNPKEVYQDAYFASGDDDAMKYIAEANIEPD